MRRKFAMRVIPKISQPKTKSPPIPLVAAANSRGVRSSIKSNGGKFWFRKWLTKARSFKTEAQEHAQLIRAPIPPKQGHNSLSALHYNHHDWDKFTARL
ncbi:MAG: hypothetical protein N2035_08840 [Chthoniobacterales bacterium]|nr:hypothetical protein [Chthoniobacterales bacterium]